MSDKIKMIEDLREELESRRAARTKSESEVIQETYDAQHDLEISRLQKEIENEKAIDALLSGSLGNAPDGEKADPTANDDHGLPNHDDDENDADADASEDGVND